ncbi:hypothetical protein [Roseovarius aquimarinus]|uniref:Uncharacterized protein n=1 Tax=Roseovarius aquimarinus TaxID=1229156 RepID=A0ABW7IAX0_9RHOB
MSFKHLLLPILLCAGAAGADTEGNQTTVRLVESGAWSVEHTTFDTGAQLCTLLSLSDDGQILDITYHSEGRYSILLSAAPENVMMIDTGTSSSTNGLPVRLDVDYDQRLLPGGRRDGRDFLFTPSTSYMVDSENGLLAALARSNAVALKDANGDATLHHWSLAGSSKAIDRLKSCIHDASVATSPVYEPSGTGAGVSPEMSKALGEYYKSLEDDE